MVTVEDWKAMLELYPPKQMWELDDRSNGFNNYLRRMKQNKIIRIEGVIRLEMMRRTGQIQWPGDLG